MVTMEDGDGADDRGAAELTADVAGAGGGADGGRVTVMLVAVREAELTAGLLTTAHGSADG